MKRDCACKRANHKHGTWLAYATDDCRCEPCRRAHKHYTRDFRKRRYLAGGKLTVDITGTRRRLQALAINGWGSRDIATHLGHVSRYSIEQWRNGPLTQVTIATRRRVAELYDELWDKPPPGRYHRKTTRWAHAQGWHPPLAWDDDEIDQPTARPHIPAAGGPWELKPCGTDAAYQRHARRGEQPCEACLAANRRRRAESDAKRKAAA